MTDQLIVALVKALLTVLTTEKMKLFVDAGLDAVENAVVNSENKIDDLIVLPLCSQIREAFNIPDED